ncbi:HAD family hydrolase [Geobacter sp. SVR]|uniref:HAD family hydrolase n=1 Tax=Geobacter sp. SVR TaxID=2495594 RepID=UPI00143EF79D|nr:HAD hydrolase-like protein [Geobacter sp. SVR]BCS55971.1 5'-nucleotidase [Geobacter sp. SVR]GCF84734.1 5'-nucleotidase [Geobacter sp. SVR]
MMHSGSPYQAVIFDLDGTLIDSSPSILKCFGRTLAAAGLQPLVPLSDSLIGPPLRQTLINLTGLADTAHLDRLVDDFKQCYDTEGYKATRVYDGIGELLSQMHALHIPLAIATNKRRIPTMKILEHLGWRDYFHIVGTLDTPTPPHANKATLISYLLKELGVYAEKSLYVGDKWEDGEAAAANGMRFCAAGWGYGAWDRDRMPQDWLFIPDAGELGCRSSTLTVAQRD